MRKTILLILLLPLLFNMKGQQLSINESEYFETRGLNVLVFSNRYDGNFSDAKISSVEVIHHGIRTATNGDVRLSPTPEQWDPIPAFVNRRVEKDKGIIEVDMTYPEYNFNYTIKVSANNNGVILSVLISDPMPDELAGRAGLNFEFLPAAYFGKTYLVDGKPNAFPLYPAGSMEVTARGSVEALPLASGNSVTLGPEDKYKRVGIHSENNTLNIYDGRNKAQNGWFVIRSLIPPAKTGEVVKWELEFSTVHNWLRTPMIAHSQVGYHPDQRKKAVIEFDRLDTPSASAKLLKVACDGRMDVVAEKELEEWGNYLRYNYYTFDFTSVTDEGIYLIQYDTLKSSPFIISKEVYKNAWHPTLDVFFPVQMDHMTVNEAYRVWHGAAHLDDALQAPVDHMHFDLYAQGPGTDSPYKPGEHIPGLNVGGWFDAGDYDIRTQTQYYVILNLVQVWENFKIMRDETTVNQKDRYVDIHKPDGFPDLLQQIEHGTLQLIAQHRAVGHAVNGIIVPDLSQYTHLGDAVTMTDNLVYNPALDSLETDGFTSGTFDDRWAFTSRSSALNYGSIAALAAASRALKDYNNKLADECRVTAVKVWDEEHSHEPDLFRHGNTTGGRLETEELKAAVELLITTGDAKYSARIKDLIPDNDRGFMFSAALLARAIPYMDKEYADLIESMVRTYAGNLKNFMNENPFGVPITRGGWAGGGFVAAFALNNYILHKAFPDIIDPELIYAGLSYMYGCHPGSNISFVSGVGTVSKKVAYGSNRADYSFIAGGIVPGVLVLKPDFPENKEDWPFLWGENEYVISLGSSYIYLVNAVDELLNGETQK